VPHVVQQRRRPHDRPLARVDLRERAALVQQPQRDPRQVIGAQRMLEPGVRRTRIDEVRPPQLPHVAQPLEDRGVHQAHRHPVELDVVPQRVADDDRHLTPV